MKITKDFLKGFFSSRRGTLVVWKQKKKSDLRITFRFAVEGFAMELAEALNNRHIKTSVHLDGGKYAMSIRETESIRKFLDEYGELGQFPSSERKNYKKFIKELEKREVRE